jgi:hypothetical protein
MRLWPRVPRKLYRIPRIAACVQAARSRALMAVYVGAAHGRGLHEANVLVQSVPARGLWAAGRGEVVPDGIGAGSPGVVDGDAGDEAVGGYGGEEGEEGAG